MRHPAARAAGPFAASIRDRFRHPPASWISPGGSRRPARRAALVAILALPMLVAGAPPARAQCIEQGPAQNYTGAGQVVCPCFVPGEQAGSVFVLPIAAYPVEILKVGIGWGSQYGGSPQSLEQAIHIYDGQLPNPGTPIFTLPGPLLTDGAINEFDLESIPGQIRIDSGAFTVTLEFLNQNSGDPFAPSVVHDGNGCQGGKNVVYALPGGWYNACSLGVSGDWVFYVKYRSLQATGQASPPQIIFAGVPAYETTCDTVHVVNTGCDSLRIRGIQGCDAMPFGIDSTMTARVVAPGDSTPIVVCVTPSAAGEESCTVTVASNATNSPTIFDVALEVATSVLPGAGTGGFEVLSAVPNPFNPSTSVRFTLPEAMDATVEILSVDGRRVAVLAGGRRFVAGENVVRWDGRNAAGSPVASGVYLFRITTRMGQRVTRLVLLK
jgi:hypothetical protein